MGSNKKQDGQHLQTSPAQSDSTEKRQYTRPILTQYGDVRDLTLSPSLGTFESGQGAGVGFKS